MRYCDHKFFALLPDHDPVRKLSYVLVVCVYCGQVRKLWADGLVETLVEEGTIKKYVKASNTNNRT